MHVVMETLTPQQLAHFETFGFIIQRGLLSSAYSTQLHDRVMASHLLIPVCVHQWITGWQFLYIISNCLNSCSFH